MIQIVIGNFELYAIIMFSKFIYPSVIFGHSNVKVNIFTYFSLILVKEF